MERSSRRQPHRGFCLCNLLKKTTCMTCISSFRAARSITYRRRSRVFKEIQTSDLVSIWSPGVQPCFFRTPRVLRLSLFLSPLGLQAYFGSFEFGFSRAQARVRARSLSSWKVGGTLLCYGTVSKKFRSLYMHLIRVNQGTRGFGFMPRCFPSRGCEGRG